MTGMSGTGTSTALAELGRRGFRAVDIADVILDRVERRTTNDYGQAAAERELIFRHLASVEPRLRASCTHEVAGAGRARRSSTR